MAEVMICDFKVATDSTLPTAELLLRCAGPLVEKLTAEERAATGMIFGTRLGCLQEDEAFDRSRVEDGGRYASPAAFARTLPTTAPAEVSIRLGLRGPSMVACAGWASVHLAIARAARWLETGRVRHVLAGGFDGGEVLVCLMSVAGPGVRVKDVRLGGGSPEITTPRPVENLGVILADATWRERRCEAAADAIRVSFTLRR